jgi:hypothetical protein
MAKVGRKSRAEELGLHAPEAATRLLDHLGRRGDNLTDLLAYLERVDQALILSYCDTTTHRQLIDSAKAVLRGISDDADRQEMVELRELVATTKALQRAAGERSLEVRQRRETSAKKRAAGTEGLATAGPSEPADPDVGAVPGVAKAPRRRKGPTG